MSIFDACAAQVMTISARVNIPGIGEFNVREINTRPIRQGILIDDSRPWWRLHEHVRGFRSYWTLRVGAHDVNAMIRSAGLDIMLTAEDGSRIGAFVVLAERYRSMPLMPSEQFVTFEAESVGAPQLA